MRSNPPRNTPRASSELLALPAKPHPPKDIAHLSHHSPSREQIQVVLAEIEGESIQLDKTILNENFIDQGSDCQGLTIKAILLEKNPWQSPLHLDLPPSGGEGDLPRDCYP